MGQGLIIGAGLCMFFMFGILTIGMFIKTIKDFSRVIRGDVNKLELIFDVTFLSIYILIIGTILIFVGF